jgi:hypothetical protein
VTREEFARRLHEAAVRAIAFARELIVNQVPDEYRFDIVIVPHGPGHAGPIVDPLLIDLWNRGGTARELTADQAVALLWHKDRVPEWIDIALDAIELPRDDRWRVVSFVQLRCSRDLVDDARLWYANEGVPLFHIQGPAMPHDWTTRHTDAEGRFDPKGSKFILPSRNKRGRS